MTDNLVQQIEELEVLFSIFGDQWKKCDNVEDTYSIKIQKDVELLVTLNDDYPSLRAPKYDLWAPNLSKLQKDLIDKEFTEISETNKGFPIIYQWIEKLKEVAEDCSKAINNSVKKEEVLVESDIKISSNLNIIHGTTITDRKSTFQGHVCIVTHPNQVGEFLDILTQTKKIAQATHNIMAYRILTEKNTLLQDCDDDGETHAGGRLLHLLEILDIKNVAVVVSRWYGGIHLGPDRFKHINNAGRQALVEAGFIK